MVIAGIENLNKSNRPAIRAFKEKSQKETISAEDIGFLLAPILNSAGRMEDASYAVDFLSSSNIYDARIRLDRLIDFNTARKAVEQEITQKALAESSKEDSVIVAVGENWHEGVVGIVAARVARAFEKPCIILTRNEEGLLKGSGRSFSNCDLFALVDDCREHLERFGGHAAAIGLSLDEKCLEAFKIQLEENYLAKNYVKEVIDPDIVGILDFKEVSFHLTTLMKQFEPYGQGNPTPKFLTKNVELYQVDTMGKEGEHLRFSLMQDGILLPGVKFKTREKFSVGDKVDIVYTVNENHFRGNVTLQLMLEKITEV